MSGLLKSLVCAMCVLFCQGSLILTDPSWGVFQNEEKRIKSFFFSTMGGIFLEVQVGKEG